MAPPSQHRCVCAHVTALCAGHFEAYIALLDGFFNRTTKGYRTKHLELLLVARGFEKWTTRVRARAAVRVVSIGWLCSLA